MDVKSIVKPVSAASYGIEASGEAADRGRRGEAEGKSSPRRLRQKPGVVSKPVDLTQTSLNSIDCEPLRLAIDSVRIGALLETIPRVSTRVAQATFNSVVSKLSDRTQAKKINKIL